MQTGNVVKNANPDIGGLGSDPDLRVPTVPMKSTDGGNTYSAKVTFPADGDWVLVIRVSKPTQFVDLFVESIVGAGSISHEDTANTPSRKAVRAIDPNFYNKYDPTNPNPGTLTEAPGGPPSQPTAADTETCLRSGPTERSSRCIRFDLTNALIAMLHIGGAGAWIISVLGLVLANRIGHTGRPFGNHPGSSVCTIRCWP